MLSHPLLIETFNWYYATVHFPAMITFLIWMFVRHRDHYPQVRNTVVLVTGSALAIQLIPVAPPRAHDRPRFRRHAGAVPPVGLRVGPGPDQLSAMPSVHVAWAVMVAIAVITASRSRWRWAAAAYPALTLLVVVVTANHFWLDGVAAGLLVLGALGLQRAGQSVRIRLITRADRSPAAAQPTGAGTGAGTPGPGPAGAGAGAAGAGVTGADGPRAAAEHLL